MVRRNLVAVLVLVAFTLATFSMVSAAGQSRQIQLGEEDTITATVSNPLNVPDILRVEFNGDAVTRGVIEVNLPREGPGLKCSDEDSSCRVILGPGEDRDLEFVIEGVREGSEDFIVTVSSETTGQRAQAAMHVEVRTPGSGDDFMTFIMRMLGIN